MGYFSKEFTTFFEGLEANNNREWFQENKKTYEKEVKEPFKAFVQEIIDRVHELDPNIQLDAKDAIFRIYKDVRFSKDKTPYKTQVSAIISPDGKKDKTNPGLYFEMGANKVRVYGGVYQTDKEQLIRIREAIANNPKEFQALLDDQKFKKVYGTLHGDQHKRIPKEFQEAHASQPLIANKQFYYYADIDPKLITSNKLADKIIEYYQVGEPMKEFLAHALHD